MPLNPTRTGRARPFAAALTGCVLAIAGCTKNQGRPGDEAERQPARPTAWPQGHSPPLKVTDGLILEIPLEYERSAISGEPSHEPNFARPERAEARFDFFLPGFSGYTLENYRNESNPDKVEVVYLHAANPQESEPDAPGAYPPNMLKRALRDVLNPSDYRDVYGLRCYRDRVPSDRITCYGRRDEAANEDIMLSAFLPPYGGNPFPELQARYFSSRYGGVRIAWRTHVRNLPRWHEIDTQIWKFIDAWRVAPPPGPTAPPPGPEAPPPGPDGPAPAAAPR